MPSLFKRFAAAFSSQPTQTDLYSAIVTAGRAPWLYRDMLVPDNVDGRFDAILLVFCLVLLRLEQEGEATRKLRGALLEQFIDDMDANMRELGVGDLSVGKEVKKMASALSGRLDAYRAALETDAAPGLLPLALQRNLWRGLEIPEHIVNSLAQAVRQHHSTLSHQPIDTLPAFLEQGLW